MQESFISETNEPPKVKEPFILDASLFGDIPARYTVPALDPHQFPVIGVYIDPRVCPGFKYYVKPLNSPGDVPHTLPPMFGGRALTLQSIGRGYSRRLTFEADQNKLTNNKNYFWSDNRQEGYVFELEVVSVGDKFTVFDSNQVAQGTMEVLNIEVRLYTDICFLLVEKKVKKNNSVWMCVCSLIVSFHISLRKKFIPTIKGKKKKSPRQPRQI